MLATGGAGALVRGLTGGTPSTHGPSPDRPATTEERLGGVSLAEVVATRRTSVSDVAPPSAEQRAAVPVRVRLPSIGVDAPVLPVQIIDNELTPPANAWTVGWWSDGPSPGAKRGAALLAGHSVVGGAGVFDDLAGLAEDAPVVISSGERILRYLVTDVRILTGDAFARWAPRVSLRRGAPSLVLVTCTGWDGSRYLSNVVVVARPIRERTPMAPPGRPRNGEDARR